MTRYGYEGLVSPKDKTGIVDLAGSGELRLCGTSGAQMAAREFSKYGLISFSREQRFKSTNYAFHFFKPVEKLKQLYNLGDEVLILCCSDSLERFKSRTKDFIDYLLSTQQEFKNRLDKVTCFLIDSQDDIEEIIKEDRIRNPDSRLIVPFSYEELQQGLDDEMLQGRLRTFLYERDLFGIASPLKDENLFFGRDRADLIAELYGKYRQGEHGGLFGLRRIGKTSILNLLRLRVEQSNGVVVYMDCTKYHHKRWNLFLQQIVREIFKKYSSGDADMVPSIPSGVLLDEDPARYEEQNASISFEEDLTSLYHHLGDTRILLIFDEIEQIGYTTSPSEYWCNGKDALYFWQAIRSVFQTNSQLLSFVITGVNPKCVELAKINGIDNPIFNSLTPQYITLFDHKDVKKMVSDIGKYVGLRFEAEIFAGLTNDYGGHPFLIRQVCSRINMEVLGRGEIRPYTVSKYSYEKHSEEYRSQMMSVIEQILGVLQDFYPAEYELLKTLALDGSDAFVRRLTLGESTVSHLLGYCLIQKAEGDYHVRIRSVSQYLKEKYRHEKTLDSWSEKRTRISIRRNDIEIKLREIIRTQYVCKFGGKAKEELIAHLKDTCKDPTQEKKIRALDLKSAMQEVYFNQLKALICKDWKNYESLFVDKAKFQSFFDLINQYRADAHAKELDEEEEAMLNIAFRYFEKALRDL